MSLDPRFRTILDTLESKGLIPLVRGDAAETRAHYRRLALSHRGPQYASLRGFRVLPIARPGGRLVGYPGARDRPRARP